MRRVWLYRFRLRLCELNSLHPNKHSDASSLLFNATYACRLGPPLCFNFLKILHEKDARGLFAARGPTFRPASTYFTQTSFGAMDQARAGRMHLTLFGQPPF